MKFGNMLNWIKFGAVRGLLSGIVLAISLILGFSALGAIFGVGLFESFVLGGFVGIVLAIIMVFVSLFAGAIAGFLAWIADGFLRDMLGKYKKNKLIYISFAFIVVGFVMSLLTLCASLTVAGITAYIISFVISIILTVFFVFLTLWIYKLRKWNKSLP